MKLKEIGQILRVTVSEWSEDRVPQLGAALAYYTAFSLAPLVLIAIGIAGLVFGAEAAQKHIIHEIAGTIGPQAAGAIEELLKHTQATGGSTAATIVGIVILLFGASGVFVQLQNALNIIWKVRPKPGRAVLAIVRERLLSFTVVLGAGFLLLVSLIVSASLAALNAFLTPTSLPGGVHLWQTINALVSFGFITLLFALIYKLLPDVQIAWRHVWLGAVLTALLFTAGKYLIGLYLGHGGVTSAFGAASSLIVILVWVYYSSQILLFGAEFTRAYARRAGPFPHPAENARPVEANEGPDRPEECWARSPAGPAPPHTPSPAEVHELR